MIGGLITLLVFVFFFKHSAAEKQCSILYSEDFIEWTYNFLRSLWNNSLFVALSQDTVSNPQWKKKKQHCIIPKSNLIQKIKRKVHKNSFENRYKELKDNNIRNLIVIFFKLLMIILNQWLLVDCIRTIYLLTNLHFAFIQRCHWASIGLLYKDAQRYLR